MAAFSEPYGFEFLCHEIGSLVALPPHLPAPYLVHERITDPYGFAVLDSNYFWVPGTDRADVRLLEYGDRLQIYRGRECLIEYALPADGVKNERFHPPGCPPPRYAPKNRKRPTAEEEKRLRAMDEVVGAWLDFALAPGGIKRHRAIRELFHLSRQMSGELFVRAVGRALHYRVDSIAALSRIAHLYLSQGVGGETLPPAAVDEDYLARDAYLEGRLTDAPDFSPWETPRGEDDEEKDHG